MKLKIKKFLVRVLVMLKSMSERELPIIMCVLFKQFISGNKMCNPCILQRISSSLEVVIFRTKYLKSTTVFFLVTKSVLLIKEKKSFFFSNVKDKI